MNLKRLLVRKNDAAPDKVFADDGNILYMVLNPHDMPTGAQDGIFSIDVGTGTAIYESRKADTLLTTVTRKDTKDTPETRRPITLEDGTRVWTLLDGAVTVTLKGNTVIVDGDTLPVEVRKFLGGLALEGLVHWQEVAKALRYILRP